MDKEKAVDALAKERPPAEGNLDRTGLSAKLDPVQSSTRSSPKSPPIESHPESDLVRAACAGDEQAFAELYKEGYWSVVRILGSELKNPMEAEEHAQWAWLRAWEKRASYQPHGSFLNWVVQIGRNHFRDENRRRKRFAEIIDRGRDLLREWTHSAEAPGPGADSAWEDKRQQLHAALAKLDDAHREIIELREYKTYSYARIAEHLGVPLGTVMSRLSAARKNLIKLCQSQPNP